jgi:mannose-1-phosphate guanylyltransferase
MKAVVLVGGEGTRLRPLTANVPKPLLPLVDRPILDHVLDHLLRHGIREVIMSSPYLESTFHDFIQSRHGEPAITWVTEREPLGTGGAIVSVLDGLDEPFFALNGDILTDLDLTAMREFSARSNAQVTIALQRVADPRPFGLVVSDERQRILEFREKPSQPIPGEINAGTYLIAPEVLRAWPAGSPLSIERDVFPDVIQSGARVVGFSADAYWIDLGTPDSYLQAHLDLLGGRVRGVEYPSPWIHPRAQIDARAIVSDAVAIGRGAVVGPHAHIDQSVVHEAVRIGPRATVARSILGANSCIEEGSTVRDSVLGTGVVIPSHRTVSGARVPPDQAS